MMSVRIAAVVFNSPRGTARANLDRMEDWVAGARAHGAAIVCFPELNITGYGTDAGVQEEAEPVPGPLTERLGAMAARHGLVILAGLAEQAEGGRICASHLAVAPAGLLGRYRKLHIAPPEQPVFSAGDRVPIFEACGIRFGIQLCYDAHFPELSTRMAIEGADVIFMPHASPRGTPDGKTIVVDAAPAGAGLRQRGLHRRLQPDRRPTAAASVSRAIAMVIGPDGRVMAETTAGTEGLLIADLKAEELAAVRQHPMRYFLPHRRSDL